MLFTVYGDTGTVECFDTTDPGPARRMTVDYTYHRTYIHYAQTMRTGRWIIEQEHKKEWSLRHLFPVRHV